MAATIVFVGLGNPGAKYDLTRHNIGFMLIDVLAAEFGFPVFSKKFNGLLSSGVMHGISVTLFKPMSYMNSSGIPVCGLLSFYKIPLSQVVVFHDDVDVPFGKIKVKNGGGSAGHNGLKSIDASIGASYWRLRIGVGRSSEEIPLADYVLSKFDNQIAVLNLLNTITKNIKILLGDNKPGIVDIINKDVL